jgi:hypothetical protein
MLSSVLSTWLICQQCNGLCAITYTPDDGLCETETCVLVAGHEPGTARKAALKTVFEYIYQVIY